MSGLVPSLPITIDPLVPTALNIAAVVVVDVTVIGLANVAAVAVDAVSTRPVVLE
jgi:hypothetical protein